MNRELGIEISSNPTLCKPRVSQLLLGKQPCPAHTDCPQEYHHVVEPLTGPSNLLLSEGAEWKKQRAIFNPGFSIQHLMSQVPIIVDILQNFVKVLEQHAEKEEIFRVEEEVGCRRHTHVLLSDLPRRPRPRSTSSGKSFLITTSNPSPPIMNS